MRNARTPDRAPLFSDIYRAPASRKSNRRYGAQYSGPRASAVRRRVRHAPPRGTPPCAHPCPIVARRRSRSTARRAVATAQETAADTAGATEPAAPKEPLPLWEIGLVGHRRLPAGVSRAPTRTSARVRVLPFGIYRGSLLRADGNGIGLRALPHAALRVGRQRLGLVRLVGQQGARRAQGMPSHRHAGGDRAGAQGQPRRPGRRRSAIRT